MKTWGDAWRLVSCFPKLRSGLFEEQGTPYSTEWFQIDFNESEQVWEGPLVPFKINLELFSSFRGSLLPKQINGKKLLFRKHGTGKKTAGDVWRRQGTREDGRGRVKTAGDAWKQQGTREKINEKFPGQELITLSFYSSYFFHIIFSFFLFIYFFFFIYFFIRNAREGFPPG